MTNDYIWDGKAWVLKGGKEYIVFNRTDGITASPVAYTTREEAEQFIKDFPKRFAHQGYYLTSRMERISPEQVILEIVEVDADE